MHKMAPVKRFYIYHELGSMLLEKAWDMVVPQQVIVEVGVDIVYLTTG